MNESFVKETPKHLALGASRAYTIDFTTLGTPSAVVSVTAYDADGTDVSSSVLTGSASLAGAVATLKLFTPASRQIYRLVCAVTISGNAALGMLDVFVFNPVPGVVTVTNGYATLDQLKARLFPVGLPDFDEDDTLVAVIEGVSRLIDDYCGRQFYQSTAEARYFEAEAGDLVFVDDLVSVTSVQTDEDGDRTYERTWTTSDYELEPANAAAKGKPYTWVMTRPQGQYGFPGGRRGVKITGTWGWSAVPKPVREGCLLQCMRLFKRKDAPFGVLGSADMGQLMVIPKLDPDVEMLLNPYRKMTVGGI